jgi:Rps23 Pro-64 3,4-dihydroxylase Tpa1-like proline 4-hydroxylase|tara:strand:+ start:1681 stop:2286 length:606 start_codon:yes stop_codon:yes gene_type:complete
MILYANIDDLALIIHEVLPKELFEEVSAFNYANIKNKERELSHKNWQEMLHIDGYGNRTMQKVETVNIIARYENGDYDYVDPIFKKVLDIVINCPWIPSKKNARLLLSYYEYNKYAGINWHEDADFTLNHSLYIHKEWDKNWGGETLIDTGRGLPLCTFPVSNSMVTIKNDVPHRVCAVTGPYKRKVLQFRGVFYNDEKNN